MESYQKLHKDCSRTIEQDAPIGNSKQHTNSKKKLKKQQDKYGRLRTTRIKEELKKKMTKKYSSLKNLCS